MIPVKKGLTPQLSVCFRVGSAKTLKLAKPLPDPPGPDVELRRQAVMCDMPEASAVLVVDGGQSGATGADGSVSGREQRERSGARR